MFPPNGRAAPALVLFDIDGTLIRRAGPHHRQALVDAVRKITGVKEGEETIGSRVRVRVVKNTIAPPFKQAEFDLMHANGISREGDLLDLAIEDKLVEKSGSWISYGDIRLGQGRENAKQYLRDNPALIEEITRKVLEKRGLLTGTPESNGEHVEAKPEPVAPKRERRQTAASE